MDLYDVIFEGKILPGKNIKVVKAEFAKLFTISSPKKLDSFFSGHPVVLKKAISLEQSDKYERALLGVGAYCHHKLIEKEKPIESIEFELTQAEDVQPAVEDDVVEPAENTAVDDTVEEEVVAAIEFEYGAAEELGTMSEDEVVESETVSGELEASGDKQPVDENSVAIEFEYAEPGQIDSLSSDTAQIDATEQEDDKSEPVSNISLANLSLVELEEKEPEDGDDD